MENNEKQGISYIVPRNVSTTFEFVPGFGMKEFFFTLGGAGISLLLFLILKITPLQVPVAGIISVVPTVMAFMLCRREGNNNTSMLTILKGLMQYNKKQHRYYYIYNSGQRE